MDISSTVIDASIHTECFFINEKENKNNTILSNKAIETACDYFKEAFLNNTITDKE